MGFGLSLAPRRRWTALLLGLAVALPAAARGEPASNVVGKVEARGDGEKTVVVVHGTTTPSFTAYRLEQPSRLVVDLANGRVGRESGDGPIEVDTWGVSQIATAQYATERVKTARVMIGLKRACTYDVRPRGNDLYITITTNDAAPQGASPAALEAAHKRTKDAEQAADVAMRKKTELEASTEIVAKKKAQLENDAASMEARRKEVLARLSDEEQRLTQLREARAEEERRAKKAGDAQKAENDAVHRAEAARMEADTAKARAVAARAEAERMQVMRAQEEQKVAELQKKAQAGGEHERKELERLRAEAAREQARLTALKQEAEQIAARRAAELKKVDEAQLEARRAADKRAQTLEEARALADRRSHEAQAARVAEERRAQAQADEANRTKSAADAAQRLATTEAQRKAAEETAQRAQVRAQAEEARVAKLRADAERIAKEATSARAQVEVARAESQRLAETQAKERAKLESSRLEAQRLADQRQIEIERANHASAMISGERAKIEAAEREAKRFAELRQKESLRLDAVRKAAEMAQTMRSEELRKMEEARAAQKQMVSAHERELNTLAERRDRELRALAEARAGEEAKIAAARGEVARARQELQALETQRSVKKAELERGQGDVQKSKDELEKNRAEREGIRAELQKNRADVERARTEADRTRAELQRSKTEAERSRAELQHAKAEAARMRAEAERDRLEAARSKGELERSRAELASSKTAADRTKSEWERSRGEAERSKTELERSRGEAERIRTEAERSKSELEARRAERESVEKKIAEARAELERAEARAREAALKAEAAQKRAVAAAAAPPPAPISQRTKELARAGVSPAAQVRDVRFSDDADSHRVVIDLKGDADWRTMPSQKGELTLSLKGASLPERLERTLDTAAYKGPVRAVSTYSDPSEPGAVRVVVALDPSKKGGEPKVTKEGDKLVWEFPRETRSTSIAPARFGGYGASIPLQVAAAQPTNLATPMSQRRRPSYSGRRIDLDFKDFDIHNILRLLSDVGQVNIITSDEVKGTVTIRMRDVPWDQALEVILRSKGLGMQREGNLIRVALQSQLEKEMEAEVARAKASIELKPLDTRLIPLSYASGDKMMPRVQELLSSRGKVSVDERTNMLIVSDVASNIALAEDLVRNLDTQTPQVLIEARIVEARQTFLRTVGIQWGGNTLNSAATGNPTGLVFPSTVGVAGAATDPISPTAGLQTGAANPNYVVNLPAPIGTGSGGGLGMTFGSLAGTYNINLRLSALESTGQVRIVSAPKITTLDNVEASIEQGVAIPISVVSAAGTNTVFVDAKLNLTVKPHVTNEGSVVMYVNLTRNEPDFVNVGARGDPTILKKQAKTEMLVRDGDTAVIGGIYTRNSGVSYQKLPWVADIPILGWLFKNRRENDDRTELLIFITPRIVNRQLVAR